MRALQVAVILSAASIYTPAHADQIFTDRAAFNAAVGSTVIEGFEEFPPCICDFGHVPNPLTSVQTALFSVQSVPTAGGTSFLGVGRAQEVGGGPGPTDGQNALIAGSNTFDTWDLVFSLAHPATAVGFDITDINDGGHQFFSFDGVTFVTMPAPPGGGDIFFGIVSDTPFSSFVLSNTNLADGWGIDQVAVKPVPLPSPIISAGLGVLALYGAARRRHRADCGFRSPNSDTDIQSVHGFRVLSK